MVLTWLAVAAALLAVGIAARWSGRRRDGLGRPRPFPRISVVLSVLLAAACGIPSVQHALLERRLGAAAGDLVGRPVTVHCQTFGETWTDVGSELGYVRWGADGIPEHRTLIKLQPCRDLADWLGMAGRAKRLGQVVPAAQELDQVVAVHVLTHEAMHMAGQTDEARAECAAVQRDARMARRLGATGLGARALARRYWEEVYPRLPDDYRSAQCRPGGQLDEQLPDPPWAATE